MAISNIEITRSTPEPDGRRYNTWRATLPDASTIDHGPVLIGGITDEEATAQVGALLNHSLASAEMRANLSEILE